MMQGIFVEITLWSDEYVMEESTDMFSKLNYIKNFHVNICFIQSVDISGNVSTVSVSTEPGRHKASIFQDHVRCYGA